MEELDVTMLPDEPPEGMFEAVISEKAFSVGALVSEIVRREDPLTEITTETVKVICSECREIFYADKRYSWGEYLLGWRFGEKKVDFGNIVSCPCCGKKVKALSTGRFYGHKGNIVTQSGFSIHTIEGRLVLARWTFEKSANRKAEIEWKTTLKEVYVLEKKKMNLFDFCWNSKMEKRKNCYDNVGEINKIYGLTAEALEGTTGENSKLDVYMRSKGKKYPISYLRLWQKHKNAENLVMQGCCELLGGLMDVATNDANRRGYNSWRFSDKHRPLPQIKEIDWNEARPSKMLGLTPEEFRLCARKKWEAPFLEAYRNIKQQGIRLSDEDIEKCQEIGVSELNLIMVKKLPLMKTVKYILRQKKKYPDDNSTDVSSLIDYWNMAEKAEFDLSIDSVKWPQRLNSAHDQAMLQQKFTEDKELIPKFISRFKQLNKLAWENAGILIRPAKNQGELKLEGQFLHHCVAGYAKSHAEGKTAIFFIRKAEEPDIPWFTLELNEEDYTVRQNRGKCNCARTKEVTEFENLWLAEIKARKKTETRRKTA